MGIQDMGMPRVVVVAAVIERQERLLVAKRPMHKRYGGKWEFPGGKAEVGESIHDTLQRELWEELNVRVVGTQPVHFQIADPGSLFTINYACTTIVGTEYAIEHDAIAWVSLPELIHYDLAPSDYAYVCFRLKQRDDI